MDEYEVREIAKEEIIKMFRLFDKERKEQIYDNGKYREQTFTELIDTLAYLSDVKED